MKKTIKVTNTYHPHYSNEDVEYWFYRSYITASRSEDPSTQNGALIIDQSNIHRVRMGYNMLSSGVSKSYWTGSKEAKYKRVIHAEMAALIACTIDGVCTERCILVCPWAACSNCAKHLVEAGISLVFRHPFSESSFTKKSHWYKDVLIGDEIFAAAGVEIVEVPVLASTNDFNLRRNGKRWPQ